MPATASNDLNAEAVERTAISLIAERGYELVTADDLANAAGLSRATFFRRFGNKDDVVFADHERLLSQLSTFLERTTTDPATAVSTSARLVLDHHLATPDLSQQRYALIREHQALRARELLLIPRYERVFAAFLRAALPSAPDWAVSAFAAGIVAVHNSVLRSWLKDQSIDAGVQLENQLGQLSGLFMPILTHATATSHDEVIAVRFAAGTHTDQIVRAIENELNDR